MPAAAERESYIAASYPTFNGVIWVHRPINLMMCIVANLTYILLSLSSDGADTNNNDECASATVADGSSARAPENECVAPLIMAGPMNRGRAPQRDR